MAYNSKEEFMNGINQLLGERNDDDALTILGEISDTYDTLSDRGSVDWEQKYKENDEAWRERYKQRFLSPKPDTDDEEIDEVVETKKVKTYDDLFRSEV